LGKAVIRGLEFTNVDMAVLRGGEKQEEEEEKKKKTHQFKEFTLTEL
jgi:hypothetical protein